LNNNQEILFYKKYSELLPLYEKVRRYIILSEHYSDNFYIASVNELRMAFDHIFRCVGKDESKIEEEFENASRHILRAGYDAAEIAATSIYERIQNLLGSYSISLINLAIPEYFEKIKPRLNEIYFNYLVNARYGKKYKKNNTQKENDFESYEKIVVELDGLYVIILKKVPDLELAKRHEKKIDRKQLYIKIIIAAFFALIGYLLNNINALKINHTKSENNQKSNTYIRDTIDSIPTK
jgi:hypothetical protein